MARYVSMKKKPDLEHVRQIAENLRAAMLKENDDDILSACCLEASRRLRDLLRKAGFKAWVVQGVFEIDNPDYSLTDGMGLTEAQRCHPLHYWVELLTHPRIVVDITADQFNDELLDDESEPIVIGQRRYMSRYRALRRNWQ